MIVQPEAREQARRIIYRMIRGYVVVTIITAIYLIVFYDNLHPALRALSTGEPMTASVLGWGGIVVVSIWGLLTLVVLIKFQRYNRIATAPTLDESLDRQQRYRNQNNGDDR